MNLAMALALTLRFSYLSVDSSGFIYNYLPGRVVSCADTSTGSSGSNLLDWSYSSFLASKACMIYSESILLIFTLSFFPFLSVLLASLFL